ncbi:cupredoxin domain-containing protein [Candidatus Microgenomates bacterium]|nr:cupredoxin domain-containing protein [Candidatus Microgenomates bacterium]
MTLDKIIVSLFSLAGIIFTYWFFLGKKEEKVREVKKSSVDIVVEGGYSPNIVSLPLGKTTVINFLRKDSNSCLEEVLLSDFHVRKYLPLNQKVAISIMPQKKGEFVYSCGMNMFHGKIVVK